MSIERVQRLLKQEESIRLEFKESSNSLPANVFDSICAMLNRHGGDILLGVRDDGSITGIQDDKLEQIKNNLITQSNNPNKLDPPFLLFPREYSFEEGIVIHIQVPESSQVHRSGSVVFDRSNEGDFRVNQPSQIAEIYNRKRTHYTEGIIYQNIQFSDFKQELFPKIRNLIKSNNANHVWLSLSDEDMLKKAGLWKRDYQTGEEGYTLAAVLLLGKDELIQQVLPHYKIDALVRRENMDRYDDREYIQTNLIDAYEKLMDFVAKHLPDKFFIEGDQRVSLRTMIFREIVANLIVHREYTNAQPAIFTIFKDHVETVNANNPNGEGPISPDTFSPFPKNPLIAKFFIQIGRVDELGSGIINVNKFIKDYAGGGNPEFIEGHIFKVVIPLGRPSGKVLFDPRTLQEKIEEEIDEVFKGNTKGVKERLMEIIYLIYSEEGVKVKNLVEKLGVSERTIKEDLKDLSNARLVYYEGSKKTGSYKLHDKLHDILHLKNSTA